MVRYRRKPITVVSALINVCFASCLLILHKALSQQRKRSVFSTHPDYGCEKSANFEVLRALSCRVKSLGYDSLLNDKRQERLLFAYEHRPYIHMYIVSAISIYRV
jgi:hypothetical protein